MRAIEGELGGSLVAQAASGDEVAFARIVAAHHATRGSTPAVLIQSVKGCSLAPVPVVSAV
jgi:hypothetical protein